MILLNQTKKNSIMYEAIIKIMHITKIVKEQINHSDSLVFMIESFILFTLLLRYYYVL